MGATRTNAVMAIAGSIAGVLPLASAAQAAMLPACTQQRWVGAWAVAPSDASGGTGLADLFDPSANLKSDTNNETTRAIMTPTLGGSEVRIHLSNRFGTAPVTFDHVTVARRQAGAALVPGSVAPLTFGGKTTITVPAGQDVISDGTKLQFSSFQSLAVDVYVAGNVGKATEHSVGRETSYLTPEGAGDKTGEVSGASFTVKTTGRLFVTGVDVLATAKTGSIVTFGDSITDGYQGQPYGIPETKEGIDANGRWPDVLAHRLRDAGRPLSVLNTGISGNRVLRDGSEPEGKGVDTYGPAALKRLDVDVLQQPGVSGVIWLEGINDIGQKPPADAASIIAGYQEGIKRIHAAGLKVAMGTLTPTGGTNNAYDAAPAVATRAAVNAWIRTSGVPDGVIDFDATVRDPNDPNRINPAYDGSDHLHFNLAGYKAMGEAVPLSLLQDAKCVDVLRVRLSTKRFTVGKAATVSVTVRQGQTPARGARIQLGRFRATTNAKGVARLRVRLSNAGVKTLTVKVAGRPVKRIRVLVRTRAAR